jgi:hypothetical protein
MGSASVALRSIEAMTLLRKAVLKRGVLVGTGGDYG